MKDRYKIVAITPAGRKRYLEILLKYILKNTHIIDEWHLWLNTKNEEDLTYCYELEKTYSFIKTKSRTLGIPFDQPNIPTNDQNILGINNVTYNIHKFFSDCIDINTIYIRFDDDIVWIEDGAIEKLIDFRIKNPEYFLVFANIINNSIMSHIHQRIGALPLGYGICDYNVLSDLGWNFKPPKNEKHMAYGSGGSYCSFIHDTFFKKLKANELNDYKFNKWILIHKERISINCFAFFGRTFFDFDGVVGIMEEDWLTIDKPVASNIYNCICGEALVSHFAYHTQRTYMETYTNILDKYHELS